MRKRATPQLLRQDAKHHSMNDFTHHTAKAAVVLLGGKNLPPTVLRQGTALKTEGIEGSERIENYQRLVVGRNVKNLMKSEEFLFHAQFRNFIFCHSLNFVKNRPLGTTGTYSLSDEWKKSKIKGFAPFSECTCPLVQSLIEKCTCLISNWG